MHANVRAAQARRIAAGIKISGGAPKGYAGQAAQSGLGGQAGNPASSQPGIVPFDQAAKHGEEPGPVFSGILIGAAQQQFGPAPLPATGYARFVKVEITTTAAGTSGTGRADYPFNLLALVRLQDTNGAPILELTGWNLFLAHTYGAFAGNPDARLQPDYSATTTAPTFTLRIPIEIQGDGMGSLANLSAASAYRLTVYVDTLTNAYSASPSPAPTIQIATFVEFWTVPAPQDMLGRRQLQSPPLAGTVQLWTQQPNITVSNGNNVTTVNRMGNMLRLVLFVARTSVFVRANTPFPNPYTLKYDDRDLFISDQIQNRLETREMIDSLTALDVGVFAFVFSYGRLRYAGAPGMSSWLPTVTSTRFQLLGASGAAGTLDLIINDIAVTPQQPSTRATEGGLGYHPPVAPSVFGAQ